jgi:rSAM/selenodomain-associated transferase 2
MLLSIIIPTLNEIQNLRRLLPYLLEHSDERLHEIIIANSEQTTDETATYAAQVGAKVVDCAACSRAVQMNRAAASAKGDVLYFIHADVLPPPNFLEAIEQTLATDVDFGCFSYQFDSPNKLLRINAYFTRFDGLFSGGGDQTLFIRKEDFEQLDGFDAEWCIMEDFDFTKRAKAAGLNYKIVSHDALVSARKYEQHSYVWVTLSNLWVFILFWLGVHPTRLKSTYQRLLA